MLTPQKRRQPRKESFGGSLIREFSLAIHPPDRRDFISPFEILRNARPLRAQLITRIEFSVQLMSIIPGPAGWRRERGMVKSNTGNQFAGLRPSGEKLISLHQFRRVYAVGSHALANYAITRERDPRWISHFEGGILLRATSLWKNDANYARVSSRMRLAGCIPPKNNENPPHRPRLSIPHVRGKLSQWSAHRCGFSFCPNLISREFYSGRNVGR